MSRQKRAGVGILEGLTEQSNLLKLPDQPSEPKLTDKIIRPELPDQSNKPQQESRDKRSYMLTEKQIDKVSLLKIRLKKSYSDIVGEAIEFYYTHIIED